MSSDAAAPSAPTAAVSTARRVYLYAEFGMLFVAVPLVLFVFRQTFGQLIIPSLVGLALIMGVLLWRDPSFDRQQLWNAEALGPRLRTTLLRFVPMAALVVGLLAVFRPELLLSLPRERTWLWLFVMGFYPVFSVYPQEVIFRTFIFHRYGPVFANGRLLILASGIAFGMAHIFFNNWIAPVMTTIGGVLFAETYARTRSTLQASLEHALWGDFIFTIGLGWYFYGGAIT